MNTDTNIQGLDRIIQSDPRQPSADADNAAIEQMQAIAGQYDAAAHGGNRLRIHLVLRSQGVADSLKRLPIEEKLAANIELYAYTSEDLWSMVMLGIRPGSDTRLDRKPMTSDSRQFVHLVLFGAGNQSESLAIHTALTAHYPNYCRDNTLRTRITMVADSQNEFRHFQQRYHNLLTNSYRRVVTVQDNEVRSTMLPPQYSDFRKNFVDVEWEFVAAQSDDAAISHKLGKWAQDEDRQLTIAFCYDQDDRNLNEVLSLPTKLLHSTPVWLRVKNDSTVRFMRQSEKYANLFPFGMSEAQLPDLSVFIRMAQCVNFAYSRMRENDLEQQQQRGIPTMEVATEPPTEQQLQQLWNNPKLTTAKRWSNIYNSFSFCSKMHSLGHTPEEWKTLFAISDREVDLMAEVEHNRWSLEELVLGYQPTTEEEHTRILNDVTLRAAYKAEFKHDDLRHFQELGVDETGLSVVRYDEGLIRTLPLLAYTFYWLQEQKS